MPLRSTAQLRKVAAAILLSGALVSCGAGPAAPPERKKFPMFTDNGLAADIPLNLGVPETAPSRPFATGYVDLSSDAGTNSYYSITLPDPAYDSLAFSLVNNYRPLALSLLSQWTKQNGGTGFIVDLRSGSNEGKRQDYSVQFDGKKLPVVLLWDNSSVVRAQSFLNIARQIPGFDISERKKENNLICF